MTLSSSIPFMMAHFTKSSVSLFWHNTADGWIDMKKGGQGWLSGGDQQVDCSFIVKSWWVSSRVYGWPVRLYCHLLGLDSHPHPQSQSQSLDNCQARPDNKHQMYQQQF